MPGAVVDADAVLSHGVELPVDSEPGAFFPSEFVDFEGSVGLLLVGFFVGSISIL